MPFPSIDYRPPRPDTDLRIGVIGAGGIVQDAHLPAYRKAGFVVTAVCDVREDVAQAVARRFDIPHAVTDPRAVIERDDVDVLDVAIPDRGRLEIVEAAAKAGKHVLIQKPLAHDLDRARQIVASARAGGIKLAVNQNARWAPEFRMAKLLAAGGHLGEVYQIRWEMRNLADKQAWAAESWYGKESRFQILYWSIHHLDLVRYWMGAEPETIYCSIPRHPQQRMTGDVISAVVMDFSGQRDAVVLDNNASIEGRDVHQYFGIEGTKGIVEGDVAHPRDFLVRFGAEPDAIYKPRLEGEWYPDGFIGSMGDLLQAIEEDRDPMVTGEDHLNTLRLVEAAYRSAASHQALRPGEL